jgi:hypothetical protein
MPEYKLIQKKKKKKKEAGSLPPTRPQITTLQERLNIWERQRGSFKARLSSNGSRLVPYCGSTENVSFCYYFAVSDF